MKRNTFFLIVILLLGSGILHAQSDKDEDQQTLYTLLYAKQYPQAKKIIEDKFLRSNDNSRKVIGYAYLVNYYSFSKDNEIKKIEALEKAKKLAKASRDELDDAYVEFGNALYYENLELNDPFVKSVNRSINIFSKYSDENFMLSVLYFIKYRFINRNYINVENEYVQSDIIQTNKYAKKSGNALLINHSYNILAYYYHKKFYENKTKTSDERTKLLDSADMYYQKSYEFAKKVIEPAAQKKALVTYFSNYSSLLLAITPLDKHKCLDMYNNVLKLSLGDTQLIDFTCGAYNDMGYLYEAMGDYKLSEKYYLKAYDIAITSNNLGLTNKIAVFDNLSRLYQRMGQYGKAFHLERRARKETEMSIEKLTNSTRSLDVFYRTERKNQLINQLEKEKKSLVRENLLYLGMMLISIVALIFLIRLTKFRQKLSMQKNELLEAEKQETQLILQLEREEKARIKAEQDLLVANQEKLKKIALTTSMRLNYKTSFIKDLKSRMNDKPDIKLQQILKEDQLNDNDFSEMENLIENIDPDFHKRLKEVSKSRLSNMDFKYASYLYLNMSNQQIANILKVDSNTVRVTKYRLKQKIGLGKDEDLQAYIQNLN